MVTKWLKTPEEKGFLWLKAFMVTVHGCTSGCWGAEVRLHGRDAPSKEAAHLWAARKQGRSVDRKVSCQWIKGVYRLVLLLL